MSFCFFRFLMVVDVLGMEKEQVSLIYPTINGNRFDEFKNVGQTKNEVRKQ